jgi:hypothetical protein
MDDTKPKEIEKLPKFFLSPLSTAVTLDNLHVKPVHQAMLVKKRSLRLRDFSKNMIEGYSKPMSAFPGETIDFYVNSTEAYSVTYLRLVDFVEGGKHQPLLKPATHPKKVQSNPPLPWAFGCNWEKTFSLKIPSQWSSGIYSAECSISDKLETTFHIVFIVKPLHNDRNYFAALANTNTWNAYNNWGGLSRYDCPKCATHTSFERPNPFASPVAPYDSLYVNHLTRSELWILKCLENLGYKVDVYSDLDFHQGIDGFADYKALILTTHPEYWTSIMFDNLEKYLQSGGHLLYLGGNGIFEKIEYSDGASELVYMEGNPDIWRANYYFRNLQPPRPERAILGVAIILDNYFSTPAPYRVEKADHRFFSGTGLKDGDLIGEDGLNGAASGREMDSSCKGTAPKDKIVQAWIVQNQGDDHLYDDDRGDPPENLQVLARGTNERWLREDDCVLEGPHSADLTYYETEWGGWVLSAGSMTFGGSLYVDKNLQRMVSNALNECKFTPRRGGNYLSHISPLLLEDEK